MSLEIAPIPFRQLTLKHTKAAVETWAGYITDFWLTIVIDCNLNVNTGIQLQELDTT